MDLLEPLLLEERPTPRDWIRTVDSPVPATLTASLAADPWLDHQLAAVLEMPGAGALLGPAWPAALLRLSASGRVDRGMLLRLVAGRLRSGDRPGALKPIVRLYRLLDPDLDERTAFTTDYLAMLPVAPLAVAEIAQQALRTLDDAGRLDPDDLAGVCAAGLRRPEKRLVRALLDWLAEAVTRYPGSSRTLLGAVAAGLHNPSVDLAERALSLLSDCPLGLPVLHDRLGALSGDLRRQAEATLGLSARPAAPTFAPAPFPYASEPLAPPLTDLSELLEELPGLRVPSAALLERLLAGLAFLTHRDGGVRVPARLRRGRGTPLTPLLSVLSSHAPSQSPAHSPGLLGSMSPMPHAAPFEAAGWVPDALSSLAPAALASSSPTGESSPCQGHDGSVLPPLSEMLASRVRELAAQIAAGHPPPWLLATPATADGQVDPARVVLRLAAAETNGWQPGPYDLSQALLRLPRRVDPAVLTAADRLVSPAGMRLAAWLREGGLPDPATSVVTAPHHRFAAFPPLLIKNLALPAGLLAAPLTASALPGPALPGAPSSGPASPGPASPAPAHLGFWPSVLPGHRELVAAHLQPLVAAHTGAARVLPALARSAGPFGPATALCLAHGLAAPAEPDRTAAVTAVQHLAATGGLDAALLGRELAALLTSGAIVLTRLVRGLRPLTPHLVWTLSRTLVPLLLRMDRPPQGTPDLLALATAAAAATGARADLPDLTTVITRPHRTRLHIEAARLARTIA